MGWYHYPRHELRVHKHPRAGYQNGVLCRFWILVGCTPKNAESLRNSDAHDACRCSEGIAAPLGCAVCNLVMLLFFALCAEAFRVCEAGVVSLPSARSACC